MLRTGAGRAPEELSDGPLEQAAAVSAHAHAATKIFLSLMFNSLASVIKFRS